MVIHTASGISAITLAFLLSFFSTDKDLKKVQLHVPHNVPNVLLGIALLWFGWFGFNAGSALAAGYPAGLAFTNTQLAPAAAMLTWNVLEVGGVNNLQINPLSPLAAPLSFTRPIIAPLPFTISFLQKFILGGQGKLFVGRPSAVGSAIGILTGLVAITPGAGYGMFFFLQPPALCILVLFFRVL